MFALWDLYSIDVYSSRVVYFLHSTIISSTLVNCHTNHCHTNHKLGDLLCRGDTDGRIFLWLVMMLEI